MVRNTLVPVTFQCSYHIQGTNSAWSCTEEFILATVSVDLVAPIECIDSYTDP